MSNFAATPRPFSRPLSPVDKASSEIIDAFSNGKYVFLDVYVEFGIPFPLRFLGLGTASSFADPPLRWKYDDPQPLPCVGGAEYE
jgi:hypothetical protein